MRPFALACLLLTTSVVCSSRTVRAESSPPQAVVAPDGANRPAAEENRPVRASLLTVVLSLGMTGLLILLLLFALSTTAVALAIEHMISIRSSVLMPVGLAEQVRQQLISGRLAAADQLCIRYPSFLTFVLRAGFSEVDGGWTAVEKGMEDAIAQQSARLFRKIETLSVIGNIAPMVGLLGTVTGMIFAFQEVADAEGAARAAQLAEGIYTALITTVGGLLVAIPSLAAFAIFRNRVDQLVAEVAYVAHHAMLPIKRASTSRLAPRAAARDS
ncbi:MAG: MotA/TolQ/ExbB proton channel family protein [Pirellulales bacterium]